MHREQFYFRDLVLPIGHLCCTEFTGEYFWECDFHCWVKDFSQRFGKFSSHFSSGASESTVSCLVLFVFFVKNKYLKTWLRYILNDLRFRLKDDIIEAIMFRRYNTQTFCLPYFWTIGITDNAFFSIRSFVNYQCFAKCGVWDNELTIAPMTYIIAILNCFVENKFYYLWSSFYLIILQFVLIFQGSMSCQRLSFMT